MNTRVLVIGGGSIGARHLRNLRTLGVGTLALVEPEVARRMALCAEIGAVGFSELQEGLAWGAEAAVIASPTAAHVAQALAAAEAGCALFIEKPLSHTLVGTPDLVAEAARRRLVTMVACNMRFHPGPAAIKRLLEENAIGQALSARLQTGSYLPRWRPAQDYHHGYSASSEQGGAILDCIHEIDLALWYCGPAVLLAAVHQPAATLGLATDGLAELLLRHESGVLGSVHLNFVQRDYRRTCQIIGSEGTISWDFAAGRVDVFGPEGTLVQMIPQPDGWQVNQMYLDEMAHFLNCVGHGRPTMNPLSGGLAALDIALAARRPENSAL